MLTRRHRLVACLAVFAVVLVACGGEGTESTATTGGTETTQAGGSTETTGASTTTEPAEPEEEQVLTFAFPNEPSSYNFYINPQTAAGVATVRNVYETLLMTNSAGEIEPWLAESYEASEDGLEYTFTLRSALFHDGTEFDAADAVYSLNANRNAENNKYGAGLENVDSIDAIDDRTVRITLTAPSPTLVASMASLPGIMVPEGFQENYEPETEAIGTGPYEFTEYEPGVGVTLTRFEDYWGERPFFDRAVQRFISDETASINALLAGDLDVISSVQGSGRDQTPTLEDRSDEVEVIQTESVQLGWMFLNPTAEKFQDERVRMAVAHAIDRQALLDVSQRGYGVVNCQPVVPYTAPYNTETCPYPYDPDRARELLAEAGAEGTEILFTHTTAAQFAPVAEVLIQQLNAVGFSTDTEGLEPPTFFERVWGNGDYELSIITGFAGDVASQRCGAVPQPANLLVDERCPTEVMALVDEASVAASESEYVSAMAEAAEMYAELAWEIPVFSKNNPVVIRSGLTGIVTNPIEQSFPIAPLRWEQ